MIYAPYDLKETIERLAKKQNSAPASELSEKTLPDAATILSHLRGKRKKTPVTLADIEAILEMME